MAPQPQVYGPKDLRGHELSLISPTAWFVGVFVGVLLEKGRRGGKLWVPRERCLDAKAHSVHAHVSLCVRTST